MSAVETADVEPAERRNRAIPHPGTGRSALGTHSHRREWRDAPWESPQRRSPPHAVNGPVDPQKLRLGRRPAGELPGTARPTLRAPANGQRHPTPGRRQSTASRPLQMAVPPVPARRAPGLPAQGHRHFHKDGICAAIERQLSNGRHEGLNNKIRTMTRRAYGFHTPEAALALVMLTCGPTTLPLPYHTGSHPHS